MSLSFPYRTTSHGHYQCSGRGALGRWKVSSHLPQYLWTLLHCICLVSGLQFKVVSALFSSPLFHFLSLIEVFLQPKCFLMECSANYSFNKTLLWTLIFSLNGGFFFFKRCWETHQLGEQGHRHKKIWPGGTHFKVSLGGSVRTTCFIVVFVCGLFTVQVGNLCACVSLCFCV